MNKISKCNNCGKQGHLFHQCKLPITSYGIVVYRYNGRGVREYLMIRRKDSFGYIDFIRGKYNVNNFEQLKVIFNEMSMSERLKILNNDFNTLWKEMWGGDNHNNSQFKNEEINSQAKFETLKNGLVIDNKEINLEYIVKICTTSWNETEWEFPKGRRNFKEKDLECALREFQEETGISSKNINVIDNIVPFEELFIGSNLKPYKHKYYVAHMNNTNSDNFSFQKSEVSKMEWKTIEDCLQSIRPYNLEKKNIIININKMLEEYRIYYY